MFNNFDWNLDSYEPYEVHPSPIIKEPQEPECFWMQKHWNIHRIGCGLADVDPFSLRGWEFFYNGTWMPLTPEKRSFNGIEITF